MFNRRIQIQNYAAVEPEELTPTSDKLFYSVIFGGVFLFFIITYPYRDISIPSLGLAMGGLLGMLGLMSISWAKPQDYWASIVFCIYIPFSGQYPGDFNNLLMGVNMTNLLLIPVILQWAMQRGHLNEPLFRFHAVDLPILLFCVLSSVSVLRVGIQEGSADFVDQFIRLKRWLTPFAVYFLYVNMHRSDRGVRYMVITLCTAMTAISILTMKESFDIGPGGSWDKIRIKGVLGQTNATGAFFVYYSLVFLGIFLCSWRKRRFWLLLIPFLMCGRALSLANSRGGLIAFALAILATFFFHSKRLFLIGLTFVILGITFPQFLPETISGRLIYGTFKPPASSFELENQTLGDISFQQEADKSVIQTMDASSQGRMRIWTAGIKLFKARPWFGWGYGEFPRHIGIYDPYIASMDPHNLYLSIASEMGVFALVAFLFILMFVMRSCLNVYHRSRENFMRAVGLAGVGMVSGLASANFFGSRLDTVELTAYFWILSAIIVQYDTELRAQHDASLAWKGKLIVNPWGRDEEEEEEEEEIPIF